MSVTTVTDKTNFSRKEFGSLSKFDWVCNNTQGVWLWPTVTSQGDQCLMLGHGPSLPMVTWTQSYPAMIRETQNPHGDAANCTADDYWVFPSWNISHLSSNMYPLFNCCKLLCMFGSDIEALTDNFKKVRLIFSFVQSELKYSWFSSWPGVSCVI